MFAPLVLVASLIAQAVAALPPSATPPFQLVVHQSNPVSSLRKADVSAIFMKRTRTWRGGSEVVAVDQRATSAIRAKFTQSIHEKSVAYVDRYWQRLIFSGRAVPPPQLESDDAVIEFIQKNRGAIGYVGNDTTLPGDVKAITVTP